MPRAQRVFDAAGLLVMPFPADFQAVADRTAIIDIVPDADALSETSFFIRDIIGRLYFQLKY